jgi:hypothetical protein
MIQISLDVVFDVVCGVAWLWCGVRCGRLCVECVWNNHIEIDTWY